MKKTLLALALTLWGTGGLMLSAQLIQSVAAKEVPKLLQVPSPDWRDQILYFILTDRFNDGNPANSDQKKGEYDPSSNAKYSGGDLAGITAKLDYIKGLGATGIWITPPVANQWWDPQLQYGGYHGYWAENFVEVDKHLGTLQDYQTLSATLHKNGMVLIQDIVANHTGNYFTLQKAADPDFPNSPSLGLTFNTASVPNAKPTQKPFDQNNFTNAKDRAAAIYHWTPEIMNQQSKTEVQNNQLMGLDDLNTENPVVANALIDSYNYWIKNVGVDGFRIDTAKYVRHDFWNVFHWNTDTKHLGVYPYAATLGKKDFLTFGEDLEDNTPYLEKIDKGIASFLGTTGTPEFKSMLNYSLFFDLRDVFQKGRPTDLLTARFKSQYKNFKDPSLLVNFIDNHDMSRFLASTDKTFFQQALLFLFTVPGIPVVYYGTEQDFVETRGSMFAKGFASGGVDRFDATTPTYQLLKALANLRKSEKEFSHGKLQVLKDSGAQGVFAYTVTDGKRTALVAINTANTTMVMDNAVTGLKAGTVLKRLTGLGDELAGGDAALAGTSRYDLLAVGTAGVVNMLLPPRSVVVLAADAAVDPEVAKLAPAMAPFPVAAGALAIAGPADTSLKLAVDAQKLPILTANLALTGTLPAVTAARLVVGGNLGAATALTVAADGTWKSTLPVDTFDNGVYNAVIQARNADGSLYLSSPYRFRIELAFTSKLVAEDPLGDDTGRSGDYRYPKNSSFTHQNDLKSVEVLTAGSTLQLRLTTAVPITNAWGPPNGFDHVHFYVYLNVPGVPGASNVLPTQNGKTPDGFTWNRKLFFGGWDSAVFSADGATLTVNGTAASPAGKATVDKSKNQIIYTVGGTSLGAPRTLSGTQIYITTWDYDGLESVNRKLVPDGGEYLYGGPANGALVMDETAVITVP